MTETEWLSSDDPKAMLRWARFSALDADFPHKGGKLISDRKLRLFACAVMHAVGRHKEATELEASGDPYGATDLHMATIWAAANPPVPTDRAALLRDMIGNPFRPVTLPRPACFECGGARRVQAGRLDCPYCPCPWLTEAVLSLARAAYQERQEDGTLDPVRLAILADALEEAGCAAQEECRGCKPWPGSTNWVKGHTPNPYAFGDYWQPCGACGGTAVRHLAHALVAHLRHPGPHVKGCWAVDLACTGPSRSLRLLFRPAPCRL